MIKKLLLSTCAATLIAGSAFSQCTINPNTPNGFYPTEAQGIATGDPNAAYSQEFHFKVPTDTTVVVSGFPVAATIDSVTFDDISGLPAGLTFQCSSSDCHYDADEAGCILLSGTITDTAGNYDISVMVTFYGTASGFPTQQAGSLPFSNYTLQVGDVSVEEKLNYNTFDVVQNYPNPFDKETIISFSSPSNEVYELNIYNVLGERVKSQKIEAQQGLNQYKFVSGNYSSGVYVYSLGNADKTITKRMVIK